MKKAEKKFRSRKFWITVITGIVSVVLLCKGFIAGDNFEGIIKIVFPLYFGANAIESWKNRD